MADKSDRDKVFDAVNVEAARSENALGCKSTQAHPEEAKMERRHAEQRHRRFDKEPDELKACANLLPEDAKLKCEQSTD